MRKLLYITVITAVITAGCGNESARLDATTVATGSSRLSELLRDDSTDRFPRALTVRPFRFPEDHGAHEDYRNEWWYFTGNLDDTSGRRFGYELTLFRFALAPEAQRTLSSSWQARHVFIGHLAVSDVEANDFYVAQRYSRGAAGLAGATGPPVNVWLEDWRVEHDGERWTLTASDDRFGISLRLDPVKPIVLNGDRGLSRKSSEPGNASYYYSIPRLQTHGEIRVDRERYVVSGLSWLDREWGSSALSPEQLGWDWFALQLSDGSDLMVYQIRKNDGQPDEFSSGTFIDTAGNATPLSSADFTIEVLDTWQSERGGRYPARWRVDIVALDASLEVVPVMADQELITTVRYWEGAVDVAGRLAGSPVSGRGYVELTGYADP